MVTDHIRYDILTQDAMRGVIRTVLQDASTRGLQGEHHFYITFDTQHPAVKLSPRIRAQYPEDMTIVLQHQFWDLAVTEEGFEVGLSFNGIREKLAIPFAAIKSFADPAVKFAMQFADLDAVSEPDGEEAPAPAMQAAATDAEPPGDEPSPDEKPSAEIVRIDRFRKK